jgi:predicted nucleic acid-binding protein
MTYLIDTDWIVDYLDGQPAAQQLFNSLFPAGVAISIITYLAIEEGILGGRDPRQAARSFQALLRGLDVLGLTRAVARRAARIRLELRRAGRPITHRAYDLLIAATAIERGLTLVTRNQRHYQDVSGFVLY